MHFAYRTYHITENGPGSKLGGKGVIAATEPELLKLLTFNSMLWGLLCGCCITTMFDNNRSVKLIVVDGATELPMLVAIKGAGAKVGLAVRAVAVGERIACW